MVQGLNRQGHGAHHDLALLLLISIEEPIRPCVPRPSNGSRDHRNPLPGTLFPSAHGDTPAPLAWRLHLREKGLEQFVDNQDVLDVTLVKV